jgi:hypothetical protein
MRRLAPFAVAVLVGFGLTGCGSSGDDNAAAPSSTVVADTTTTTTPGAREVTWSKIAPPIKLTPPFCDAEQHCVYPATSTGTFTGDLDGSVVTSGGSALDATGKRFAGGRTDLFVGTIEGCGEGTVVMVGVERATLKDGEGEWQIVEGFGTGALKNVSGHGTGKGTVDATGIRANFEGEIVC